MTRAAIVHADCLVALRQLDDASVDAVVTDPPAGIEFMGKEWDSFKKKESTTSGQQTESWGSMAEGKKNPYAREGTPRYRGKKNESLRGFQDFICEVFTEVYRVLKPGGHAVVWALPRTSHHTAMGLERAGFDIRDNGTYLFHVFGSGFPKSHNLDGEWEGWGTALKPAVEFWILARKPLDGTVAENVLAHGTGALNVDGCRVGTEKRVPASCRQGRDSGSMSGHMGADSLDNSGMNPNIGRWPANLIHDGSDEVVGLFPETHGAGTFRSGSSAGNVFAARDDEGPEAQRPAIDGGGSTARFFYCAKASKADRDEGLDDLPERSPGEKTDREEGSAGITAYSGSRGISRNNHPTVKSTALMSWLVRLVTSPGGLVLDPFMGSGSTGKAALIEGFSFLGIEREAEYVEIARRRLKHAVGASVDVVRLEEP
jgi:site-specific DNA-methyltransferase (adenine-specific)